MQGSSLVAGSRGYSLVEAQAASLVGEHRLGGTRASVATARGLSSVTHGLICSEACGIFPDQG